MDSITCDAVINNNLISANTALANNFKSHVIFLKSSMQQGVDDIVKDEIEEISSNSPIKNLTVVLETNGGSIETVERLVGVFRRHYDNVEFIVPNYAYSAGTILVLSGDQIHMDYYSVLGPIDPQIGIDDQYVPGMGYLAKFKELTKIINTASDSASTRAELAFLIKRFEPAMLFIIEQATEHSKALIREWLPNYKFKNWHTHSSTGEAVTQADREERANKIATELGNAEVWHSHGRGIGIKELQKPEIKLMVNNYGDNSALNKLISEYYGLLIDFMRRSGFQAALHTPRGLRRLA